MGYTLSLPAYTEQPEKVIYEKVFTGSPVFEYVKSAGNIQTGIKSAETINLVATEGVWQSQACSLNPSGTTTFTQRTITVGKPKVDLSWCERDLEAKFTQKKLAKGGNYDSLAYNTEIVDDVMQNIAKRAATAIWQGDTTSTDEYLNKFDGLIKLINAATIGGTYSGTAWSEANSRTVMKGLAALVIADQDVYMGGNTNIKFFCSPAVKAAYKWKLINDNVGYKGAYDNTDKLFVEGTNIEVVEDPGLAGTNYIFAIEPDNIYVGTDMENEQERVDLWFSKDDQKIYFHTEWKMGVNFAFGTRIYKYLGV